MKTTASISTIYFMIFNLDKDVTLDYFQLGRLSARTFLESEFTFDPITKISCIQNFILKIKLQIVGLIGFFNQIFIIQI